MCAHVCAWCMRGDGVGTHVRVCVCACVAGGVYDLPFGLLCVDTDKTPCTLGHVITVLCNLRCFTFLGLDIHASFFNLTLGTSMPAPVFTTLLTRVSLSTVPVAFSY